MKKLAKYLVLACITAILAAGCGKKDKGNELEELNNSTAKMQTEELKSGSESEASDFDIALVMDASGSMLASDKERIAVEASKMFIDMEKASGINVSVIEFSNNVKSDGMIALTDQNAKDFVKNTLQNITYVNRAHTDTGAALMEAVNQLKAGDAGHKKAILLFTDGRTEISSGERTIDQSRADIESAISEASAMGCPIYTVGLNNNGKVDEAELSKMSVKTAGLTLIANDVRELPEFFNEIFKTLGNIEEISIGEITADGDYQSVDIPIDNDSILEANIVMLSNMQIEDIRLYSPNGEEIPKDGGKIIFTSSAKYSVVKMMSPQSGIWRLEVKGISGDQIKISLLYNYNINMITNISQSKVRKGDVIDIVSYLTNEGYEITDTSFYGKMEATATVTNLKTGAATEIPLELIEGRMMGKYEVSSIADLRINVHIEGQGLYRNSDDIVVEAINQDVIQIKNLPSLDLEKGESGKIDLAEYFKDPDGENVSFKAVSSDDEVITIAVEGSVLSYSTSETKGDTTISIIASDEAGSQLETTIRGSVNTFFGHHKLSILAAVAAIVSLGIILVVREISKKSVGYMIVSLSGRTTNEYGGIESKNYNLATGISVASLGRKFTLQTLLRNFAGAYANITYDQEKVMGLNQIIAVMGTKAAAAKFIPTGNKQKMIVTVSGNSVSFCDIAGNIFAGTRSQTISCDMSNPTTFYIRINMGSSDNECVVLTIQYKI